MANKTGALVKMCGNTNREDLELLARHGVDFAGIIVGVPWSARNVAAEHAEALFADSPVRAVLVVVDPCPEELRRWVELWRPFAVQLHGDENPELVRTLSGPGAYEVWKTLHLPPAGEDATGAVGRALERAEPYGSAGAARFVIDTAKGQRVGGTGLISDWSLAAEMIAGLCRPSLLAGGLTSSNVAEALRTASPAGVDVAGGVEAAKGRKDPTRVASFMAAVRGARDGSQL